MRRPWQIWAIVVVTLLILASATVALIVTHNVTHALDHFQSEAERPPVYCIMITGKEDRRIPWARLAVENFKEQTYIDKHLIIINHHPTLRVLPSQSRSPSQFNITEIPITKQSLGTMRNIALELVPFNSVWITWDDDDVRSPSFLATLQSHMTPDTFAVAFSNRMEVNIDNDFVWQVSLKPKGTVHMMVRATDRRIRYLEDRDTMEDVNLYSDITDKYGHAIQVLQDNDPMIYIRTVHGSNTSLYVDPKRDELKYSFETQATPEQRAQVLQRTLQYKKLALL